MYDGINTYSFLHEDVFVNYGLVNTIDCEEFEEILRKLGYDSSDKIKKKITRGELCVYVLTSEPVRIIVFSHSGVGFIFENIVFIGDWDEKEIVKILKMVNEKLIKELEEYKPDKCPEIDELLKDLKGVDDITKLVKIVKKINELSDDINC